jgi:two-component system, cell cycle sensor histidine kinase and response regulator CckA
MKEQSKADGMISEVFNLYELSLAAGQSLDFKSNCDHFLKTLMAQRNLFYASVWIRGKFLRDSIGWNSHGRIDPRSFYLAYAVPRLRIRETVLHSDHPILANLSGKEAFSIASSEKAFAEMVTEKEGLEGTLTVFALGKLGLLKLLSTAREEPLADEEWGQLRNVISKFAISLEGSLVHESLVHEISEREQAEEVLKESEARYRSLFDGVPVGLYRTTPDGQVVDANLSLIEMLGYSDRESFIRANADQSYIKPEDRMNWQNLLEQEEILQNFEKQLRRRDGTPIWVEENARVYRNQAGQVLYYEGSLEEITEKKRAAEEMLSLQGQLRQSQKMEAIGRLAGGIAHDFNNLLTVISGYSQLSLSLLQEGNSLRDNILEIQRATERAAALTRQLLAFSRRQILDMKLIDLNLIIQDIDKMLRRVIGEDIELVTLLAGGLWKVKSDPSQIEQVILNLAVNSRDAMPKGGRLSLESSNTELDQEYARSHMGVKPGPYVKLLVRDTGVGMPLEVQERVFEPFFTTKEKGKGTGLGLSTVYGIIKQSGGNIWVQSELGQGTTFEIYLPRADEHEITSKPGAGSPLQLRGSETILLVEDEEAVRTLARKTLQSYGYHLLEAANGEEGFRVAAKHGKKIHLLLTDVIMPGISGREMAERLSPYHPEMKVLYITGYTDTSVVQHGILEPGTALLLKPFKPDALAQKVREALNP